LIGLLAAAVKAAEDRNMSTGMHPVASTAPPILAAPPKREQVVHRVLLYAVTWQEYNKLLEVAGERRIRLTYDRGTLEIMTRSGPHEWWKERLNWFIRLIGIVLRLDVQPYGSVSQRREDLARGLEPDECFYIGKPARVRGPRNIDLTQDPAPDLAIEIDISRSSLDRMSIYAALGIPEVWRFDGELLRVYLRQPDGSYQESRVSRIFPLLPLPEFAQLLLQSQSLSDMEVHDAFPAWAEANGLVPEQGTANGS
jgi:Uma2 family endonuclease